MRLVVFGASGPTGRHVVRQALARDHRVVAVTRDPGHYPLKSPDLEVVEADVFDAAAVERAVSKSNAVISTFGVPYTRKVVAVYSEGIANITRAMTQQGISRLVCVSSTGVSTREVPGETLIWRKMVVPFFRNVLGRTLYDDMRRMEEAVRTSGLDWTIVRPAGLFDTAEPTPDYEVGVGRLFGRMTSRADLAQTLIREAVEARHSRRTIEVVSHSQLPTHLAFLRNTFGKRSGG